VTEYLFHSVVWRLLWGSQIWFNQTWELDPRDRAAASYTHLRADENWSLSNPHSQTKQNSCQFIPGNTGTVAASGLCYFGVYTVGGQLGQCVLSWNADVAVIHWSLLPPHPLHLDPKHFENNDPPWEIDTFSWSRNSLPCFYGTWILHHCFHKIRLLNPTRSQLNPVDFFTRRDPRIRLGLQRGL